MPALTLANVGSYSHQAPRTTPATTAAAAQPTSTRTAPTTMPMRYATPQPTMPSPRTAGPTSIITSTTTIAGSCWRRSSPTTRTTLSAGRNGQLRPSATPRSLPATSATGRVSFTKSAIAPITSPRQLISGSIRSQFLRAEMCPGKRGNNFV